MRSGSRPPEIDDPDVLVALLVEPCPHLVHQVGRDPAALRRRVQPDAVQLVAQGVRHPQRLLGLVLERVDEHDPRHVRPEVAIERQRRLDRVAEDQHQRVGHRPGRRETGQPRPGGRRRADAAAHDRGVIEHVGDVGVDVAGAEADDRLGGGRHPRTSRAAVAQPVDWASMPRNAVSYRPNRR